MDLDYTTNINSISGFYDNILQIKDDFFVALKSCNKNLATAIIQETNNGRNINKQKIVDIYKDAADKQNELEQDRANIINNMNALADYKILLEYENATTEAFDTMSPQIMSRDSVTLYNLQYLQIFCKVLGIVIIIAIFWKYFSSITGMASLSMPSIIPQALPQVLPQSLPQAAST